MGLCQALWVPIIAGFIMLVGRGVSWTYFSASGECLWSFLGSALAVVSIPS